ncbi:ESCRT-III subunit protein did4 [Mycoemilia scoparia]|uniref:ESCRT-III subunit protein did4 n=1 Tax=Mycoemilia scoparia TaxID=417184 RepID=A0A9W8A9F7_9FUNG|nr:ESCRT-III subunit protein did4 [Mycoemilia scoparia]
MLEFLFGKKETPQEKLRRYKRELTREQRKLEREKVKLANQEKTLLNEIRRAAKAGNTSTCKIKAKNLTMSASQQMAQSVRGAAVAMKSMNGSFNLESLQRILMEFEKQSEMMNMKDELVSETIDEAMEDTMDDEEEETDKIVQQVLDEVGIELKQSLGDVPQGIVASAEAEEAQEDASEVAALQARLDNLRRE